MNPYPRNVATPAVQRNRVIKDRLTRWSISLGGIGVVLAIVLIFFYLIFEVAPLFRGGKISLHSSHELAGQPASAPLWSATRDRGDLVTILDAGGRLSYVSTISGEQQTLAAQFFSQGIQALVAESGGGKHQLALLEDGGLQVFQLAYRQSEDASASLPAIELLYGETDLPPAEARAPDLAALRMSESGGIIAALYGDRLQVYRLSLRRNLLSGETTVSSSADSLLVDAVEKTGIALSADQRWLYLGAVDGQLRVVDLSSMEWLETITVSNQAITGLEMLSGGISVVAADAAGDIYQLFPVRDAGGSYRTRLIRSFTGSGPLHRLVPERYRRGFLGIGEDGLATYYYATSEQRVLSRKLGESAPMVVSLSPSAGYLSAIDADGRLNTYRLRNPHPEFSWSAVWNKIWYERYDRPDHVWQSSVGNTDIESKFSLTPLTFGTFKAALYTLLFAIPIALMGAIYTAYFMAPKLRQTVKPTIEIMEALPTVILGFMAGLWFAPMLDRYMAEFFSILLLLPLGCLLFGWFWASRASAGLRRSVRGWQPLLLLPVLVTMFLLALLLAQPLESWFFGGNMNLWLTRELGIDYNQRNALVVGVAMGFAVIPTIFSIAEDAIFSVPRSLSNGSLALGATPWQSVLRVVLPMASPGIFSALMIGLGRAVGETMIVLMATGNTPIIDWNMFEGMRTLSANIAIEMPESEVGSTHYRILFLAALLLFALTFAFNTVAELVRQRLRERYSAF